MSIVVNLSVHRLYAEKLCDRRYLNDEIKIDGKVVIVTGGSSGLGLETARNLAGRGGRIYIASRDERKGNRGAESIRKSTGNQNVQFIKLNLASLKSVREFSETFHKIEKRLDILINNAGTASAFEKTEDNFELNMAVNHLGHFLLTNLLLDLLKASAPSRILVVSSIAHQIGLIIRDNLNSEIYFPGIIKAYSNSKLANILFTRELSRKLENSGVTVNSLDPGISMSAIGSKLPSSIRIIFETLQQLIGRNPEHGAQTHLMLAVDQSVKNVSGKHFRDCIEQQPSYFARDKILARWFWADSAKLTKLYQPDK
ncbi:retinol dehydrogenase 11-like [Bradysia coprophila]|uniref:retinol dehydrogenase 11-like n=1 Tax=Bradysia coprophila TaxID=38358 RepID=UPI00187DACD5|nr:retinol dehydrogenase 11-like [Bradysia coprophila]